jgi:predicted ATPase
MVDQRQIIDDTRQFQLVKLMEKLRHRIQTFDFQKVERQYERVMQSDNALSTNHTASSSDEKEQPTQRLRGLYIHGPVGSGKTMLMDMLFHHCNIEQKRRVHFHEFLLEVHRRIHEHKQMLLQTVGQERHINFTSGRDSIRYVAEQISKEAKLFCFDEFQVTDICDALILTKLFNVLWSRGTILIATSNRPPTDLYLNGLNRHDFLPFIERIQQECIVKSLDGDIDYRLQEVNSNIDGVSSSGNQKSKKLAYYTPISEENSRKLLYSYFEELEVLRDQRIIRSSSGGSNERRDRDGKIIVPISNSRHISVLYANIALGICFTDFQTLCLGDRGSSDYRALTKHFHTIYIDKIPKLSKLHHNSARRFIILIDELYNANIRVKWTADAAPFQLFDDAATHDSSSTNVIQETENSTEVLERMKAFEKAHEMIGEFPKYGRNYQPG